MPVGEVEALGAAFDRRTRRQIEDALAHQDGGGVRAVSAGVHPERAAHRARHPHGPFESHQPGGGAAPGDERAWRAGAGAHGRAGDVDGGEAGTGNDHESVEAGVGDEHVRAVAEDQQRHRHRRRRQSVVHGDEIILVVDLDEEGGGAPHPIGGACPERSVAHGPRPEGPGHRARPLPAPLTMPAPSAARRAAT